MRRCVLATVVSSPAGVAASVVGRAMTARRRASTVLVCSARSMASVSTDDASASLASPESTASKVSPPLSRESVFFLSGDVNKDLTFKAKAKHLKFSRSEHPYRCRESAVVIPLEIYTIIMVCGTGDVHVNYAADGNFISR